MQKGREMEKSTVMIEVLFDGDENAQRPLCYLYEPEVGNKGGTLAVPIIGTCSGYKCYLWVTDLYLLYLLDKTKGRKCMQSTYCKKIGHYRVEDI